MKKKVGIITFHIAHNYGAMLQAYALQKSVENLGHPCEIIHYCFPYIYRWSHIERLPELRKKYGIFKMLFRFAKNILRGRYNPRKKQYKFEHFIYHSMVLSQKAYHSFDELDNMDYDVILFGSDQIWNSQLTNGIAKAYAGGFRCMDRTRKISYAASCGRNEFDNEEKEHYYPLLNSFHALGVREKGLANSLRNDGFAAQQVLDPTLLLTKEQWMEFCKSAKYKAKILKKDYLLVYAFDEDPMIYSLIDRIADRYGLEVCVIAYRMKKEIKKYHVYQNCGPEEFVQLFSGASRVVTTSFHGTVFSILCEKEFYCIPHPTLHERTDSLLSSLNLDDRNCSSDSNIDEMPLIDWVDVKKKLSGLRDESLNFLKEAIE